MAVSARLAAQRRPAGARRFTLGTLPNGHGCSVEFAVSCRDISLENSPCRMGGHIQAWWRPSHGVIGQPPAGGAGAPTMRCVVNPNLGRISSRRAVAWRMPPRLRTGDATIKSCHPIAVLELRLQRSQVFVGPRRFGLDQCSRRVCASRICLRRGRAKRGGGSPHFPLRGIPRSSG